VAAEFLDDLVEAARDRLGECADVQVDEQARGPQHEDVFGLRAYPGRSAAIAIRQAMRPQASWSRARWF
jgi:hypothetical protein